VGHANFSETLRIKEDGRTVSAWGPNAWDPDDEAIEVYAVAIAQGNVVARSTGSTHADAPEEDWWLDAVADGELKPGKALAGAMAIYRREDDTRYPYAWTDEVKLVDGTAASDPTQRAHEAAYESGT
jgi:hypothetical protein